jgi:hypothetical protein
LVVDAKGSGSQLRIAILSWGKLACSVVEKPTPLVTVTTGSFRPVLLALPAFFSSLV